jgi:hypothetical protein
MIAARADITNEKPLVQQRRFKTFESAEVAIKTHGAENFINWRRRTSVSADMHNKYVACGALLSLFR